MGAPLYLFQKCSDLIFLQRVHLFFDDARKCTGIRRIDAQITDQHCLLHGLMKNAVNILYCLCRKGIDCRVGRGDKLIVKVLYCMGVQGFQLDVPKMRRNIQLHILLIEIRRRRFHPAKIILRPDVQPFSHRQLAGCFVGAIVQ